VTWRVLPMSGAVAMAFTVFGVALFHLWYRTRILISFNNINCVLVPANRRITYFHQLKALDPSLLEPKIRVIRTYLHHTRETIVVQSLQVQGAFEAMFGRNKHEIIVAWPGIKIAETASFTAGERMTVLVPVAAPESPHKNFAFALDVARHLAPGWRMVVTAPEISDKTELKGSNIEFVGVLSRENLFKWYRRATVVLMPSTHETIGLPIFEALVVGTPVVAYDADYIRALNAHFSVGDCLSIIATPQAAVDAIEASREKRPGAALKRKLQRSEWHKVFQKAKR